MPIPGIYQRRVIHINKKNSDDREFITVANRSGVQWASCNTGVKEGSFLSAYSGGGKSRNVSWVTWLFLLPGLGLLGIATPEIIYGGITIGAITAIQSALASLLLSGAAYTGIHLMPFLQKAGEIILQYLPAGSRVQFVKFEQPCNEETAGVNF